MRILILDDDALRHETFIKFYKEDTVVCAQRYMDFSDELWDNLETFDLIHLDHDLGDNGDTYTDGWGKEVAYSGKDAVDLLAVLGYKKKAIVHTMNSAVGSRMTDDLRRAGIDAERQSFDHFLFR